jgi:hypothetical protein
MRKRIGSENRLILQTVIPPIYRVINNIPLKSFTYKTPFLGAETIRIVSKCKDRAFDVVWDQPITTEAVLSGVYKEINDLPVWAQEIIEPLDM